MLLVDDDPASLHLIERFVEKEGFDIRTCTSAEEAEVLAQTLHPHVLLTDVVLPGMDGFTLISKLRSMLPDMEVILLTGHASVERAVEAIRDGASDYIEKPVDRSRLIASLRKVKQQVALRLENTELRNRLKTQAKDLMVGQSPAICEVRETIERIAGGDMNVFVQGESGTGKEVAAELLHKLGARVREQLVKVSCAAIPDHLLESEMFGYEKGAFTGATQSKAGKFEIAHKGTLFLDEIGEMSTVLQAKLLRVLQDGQFSRLGSNEMKTVNVRVISATNVKVEKAISEGKFREDLFYRLNVVYLKLPPLRERLEDIPLLVTHLLNKIQNRSGIETIEVTPEAIKFLQSHHWPGNVRELANTVERAVALRKGDLLDAGDFSFISTTGMASPKSESGRITIELGTPLDQVEERMIRAALDACAGDKEKAASLLGISSRTIYRKLG
jgi:two-component system, NtrC family, response regulator HydG